MTYVLTTMYVAAIWASVNRLVLYCWGRKLSPKSLGYLIVSTIWVAMTTLMSLAIALAATR